MARKRKAYAPFSLTSEAGVAQTPLEGYIDVDQQIYPSVNTGTINENGKWSGVKSDDVDFIGFTKHVAVGNGGDTINPDTNNHQKIDMTGFSSLQFAFKTTRAGNYNFVAQMGPDTERFANITAGAGEKVLIVDNIGSTLESAMEISSKNIGTNNVFFVFTVLADRLKGQKNLVIRITNDSGGNADIDFAFRRLV
jgi:hypothetical protein